MKFSVPTFLPLFLISGCCHGRMSIRPPSSNVDNSVNAKRLPQHGDDGHRLLNEEKGLTYLNATMTSFYEVSWGLAAGECDNHFMSVDLQCEGILLLLEDDNNGNNITSKSTCSYLTGNPNDTSTMELFNWIRCTSTMDTQGYYGQSYMERLASTRVRCVGETIESHALIAQTSPLYGVDCDSAGAAATRLMIHRLSPAAQSPPSSSSNVFADSDDGNIATTAVDAYTGTLGSTADWERATIQYSCLNSEKDNEAAEYICYVIDPIFCYIVAASFVCDSLWLDSMIATIWYSGIDTAYLLPASSLDSKLYAATLQQDAILNQEMGSVDYPTNASIAASSLMTTDTGNLPLSQRASYKVYFDQRSDASDCLFALPSIYLMCGSGLPPAYHRWSGAVCFNIFLPHTGHLVTRCASDTKYSSNIIVKCDGTTAADRELFVSIAATSLSQCMLDSAQNETVSSLVWFVGMCDGEEELWGEKGTCWNSTYSGVSTSGRSYCQSDFVGCVGLGQNCTVGLLAASVSTDTCLEPTPEPESNAEETLSPAEEPVSFPLSEGSATITEAPGSGTRQGTLPPGNISGVVDVGESSNASAHHFCWLSVVLAILFTPFVTMVGFANC